MAEGRMAVGWSVERRLPTRYRRCASHRLRAGWVKTLPLCLKSDGP